MQPTERQRALFAEHVAKRTDGSETLTLEDMLKQLEKSDRLGISDRELAEAWGTPIDFVRSLRDPVA